MGLRMIGFLLACFTWAHLTASLESQAATSKSSAVVVVLDGSVVEISDVAIYGPHTRTTTYFAGRTTQLSDLVVRDGEYWRAISIDRLDSLSCGSSTQNSWLRCDVSGAGFGVISGVELPLQTIDTWLSGSGFELQGTSRLLGVTATFALELGQIRSMTRQNAVWRIRSARATEDEVANLRLVLYSQGDPFGGSAPQAGAFVTLHVGAMTVPLQVGNLDSLTILPDGKVRVRTIQGETAEGSLPTDSRIFGRMWDGRILFRPVRDVRSIKFQPLKSP